MLWNIFFLFTFIIISASNVSSADIIKPVPKPDNINDRLSIEELLKKSNTYPVNKVKNFPKPFKRPEDLIDGVLSDRSAKLYKEIFSLQSLGKWKEADKKISLLRDRRLMGHVLYQRYMHDKYHSSFKELKNWMEKYYDYPFSHKIYRIALTRGNGNIKKPTNSKLISGSLEILSDRGNLYKSKIGRTENQDKAIGNLLKIIKDNISRERPTTAYNILKNSKASKYLDNTEFDMYKAQIAAGYMYVGKDKKALSLALEAINRSGNNVPLAGWVAGMVAWKNGYYENAAKYFEVTATSPYTSRWTSSAGAYWASRAYMRERKLVKVSYWLRKAAEYPRTFYGLIAVRALGQDFDFNWDIPKYNDKYKNILMKYPAAKRAAMLVQAGQYNFAERELRLIRPKDNYELKQALLAFSSNFGLASYSLRFGSVIYDNRGNLYDGALYPDLKYSPVGGYKIDRALIHAIARQESRFNPEAESYGGAIGLMQIMPSTANYIKNTNKYSFEKGKKLLKDSAENLTVGQEYVKHLMSLDNVGNDLMFVAIAYNAGPGNLRKWKKQLRYIDDSLLFIESIPVAETRAYVERVLSNFWIYRIKYGQPTPSLDDVVAGRYTKYVSLDENISVKIAEK